MKFEQNIIKAVKKGIYDIQVIGGYLLTRDKFDNCIRIKTEIAEGFYSLDAFKKGVLINVPAFDLHLLPEARNVEKSFSIKEKDLSTIVSSFKFTAKDVLRLAMTCVSIDSENITATDAHVLSWQKHDISIDGNFLLKPSLAPYLKAIKSDIVVNDGAPTSKITTDRLEIAFLSETERFPNYEAVIPKWNDKSFSIDKKELKNIVNKCLLAAGEMKAMAFNVKGSELTITGECSLNETSHTEKSNTFKNISGDDFLVKLNGKFILNIISVIKENTIMFKYGDGGRALIINDSFLIMPISL